jgi:hypothetical protein
VLTAYVEILHLTASGSFRDDKAFYGSRTVTPILLRQP